jgi:16S rRNA (cytosine967-C5)-methyltransferase
MSEQLNSNIKNYEGRWSHLYKLWRSAVSQESLPQIDRWLAQEFAKNSKYGSRDRRWYSECLFAGIRYSYFALFCEDFFNSYTKNIAENKKESISKNFIENFKKKYSSSNDLLLAFRKINEERLFVWIRLRYLNSNIKAQENISFEFQENVFSQEKSCYNIVEKYLKEQNILLSQMLMQSIPLWFREYIEKRVSLSGWDNTQQENFFSSLEIRPPMWLRLNDPKYSKNVLLELKSEGYEVEGYDALTLKVLEGKGGIFAMNAFRAGLFEIQDLASQQIGQHVEAKFGQFIWDSCAGGGGKTQQIASYLKNKGVIYASDIREYKLEEVKKRARKSGFFNIRCLPWNGEGLPNFQREVENNNGFDWVLVDAPCSSSGTWRRNPDSKYRISKENLLSLTELQLNIIQTASSAVRTGGHIVYSTCSWIYEENENIVECFLTNNPEFTLVKQHILGSPFENADTMFVAVMQKVDSFAR